MNSDALKKQNKIAIACGLLFAMMGQFVFGTAVYATVHGDASDGEEGVSGSCSSTSGGLSWNRSSCGDETGGASWHVFVTTSEWEQDEDNPNYGMYKTVGSKYQPSRNRTSSNNCGLIAPLCGSPGDVHKIARDVSKGCPKSKYSFYVALVLDGWKGKDVDGDSVTRIIRSNGQPYFWGPIGHSQIGDSGSDIRYHSDGTHSLSDVRQKISSGDYAGMNGWRISESTAKALYNDYTENDISDFTGDIGYFCGVSDVTLTGYAKCTSGDSACNAGGLSWESFGDNELRKYVTKDTGIAYNNNLSVTVNSSYTGFSRTGWGANCTDTTGISSYAQSRSYNAITCGYTNLKKDRNVYQYYIRDQFLGKVTVSGYGGASTTAGFGMTDTDQTANMDCPDDGCDATFYGYVRKGDSRTTNNARFSKFNGAWTNQSVTNGASGTQVDSYSGKLYPGETVCKALNVYPYWTRSNTYTATIKACMAAKLTEFEAKANVAGAANGTTDWQKTGTTKNVYINNCDPTSGCKVTFNHQMRRTGSIGSTDWKVVRTSNLTDTEKGIATDTTIANGNINSGNAGLGEAKTIVNRDPSTGEYTLYPGMVVCEEIQFRPNNAKNTTSDVGVKVCASALGNAQPDDPSNPDEPEDPGDDPLDLVGSDALINLKIRNENVNQYSLFQNKEEVYAKPEDTLAYRATYNPRLQYTFYLKPQAMRTLKDGSYSSIYPASGINQNTTLGGWSGLSWRNAFTLQRKIAEEGNSDSLTSIKDNPTNTGTLRGEIAKRKDTDSYKVLKDNVGNVITERATMSVAGRTNDTPQQVTFTNDNDRNLGTANITPKYAEVLAKVPYNFTNEIEITTEEDVTVYAGETQVIAADIAVNKRQNDTTEGEYATIVRNAHLKLQLCINGQCRWTEPMGVSTLVNLANDMNILNADGGMDGIVEEGIKGMVVVPDVPAGSKACVRAAVYPKDSHDDKNISDHVYDINDMGDGVKGNSGSWAISDQVCYTVAKKPVTQVWGGNVYSAGNIETSTSRKYHIAAKMNYWDLSNYGPDPRNYQIADDSDGKYYLFGSWGELGVVANGTVKGFASGGSLGYAKDDSGILSPLYNPTNTPLGNNDGANSSSNPGGGRAKDFCVHSRLTFANATCSSEVAGGIGILTGSNRMRTDVTAIINKLVPDRTVAVNATTVDAPTERYYYNSGAMELTGWSGMRKRQVVMVHSGGDITISGDLRYSDDNAQYETLSDIPKLVVYAEGDIEIRCDVGRIDGLLIAEGSVKTCVSGDGVVPDVDDEARSRQLIVDGAIIANKLEADRTYGAATGMNSIIPAEIIDFDPSLYMWAGDDTETKDNTGGLESVILDEVSPRL